MNRTLASLGCALLAAAFHWNNLNAGEMATHTFRTFAETTMPSGIALDRDGNTYVVESAYNRIRKFAPDGSSIILAGPTEVGEGIVTTGYVNGPGHLARFNFTTYQFDFPGGGVAVDESGNVYVADTFNGAIRKITPEGMVSTFAGNPNPEPFWGPMGVAVDRGGNVYVADTFAGAVRKIDSSGRVSTIYVFDPFAMDPEFSPKVVGITVDYEGMVYVASAGDIWKIRPNGEASVFATGFAFGHWWYDPSGALAVDAIGNVYVADTYTSALYKVTPDGTVALLAGSGEFIPVVLSDYGGYCSMGTPSRCFTVPAVGGFSDGAGAAALLFGPTGVAVDAEGNLHVADRFNNAIRIGSPAPAIEAALVGARLNLSWPAEPSGFTLQTKSADGGWETPDVTPTVANGRFTASFEIAGSLQTFRLAK